MRSEATWPVLFSAIRALVVALVFPLGLATSVAADADVAANWPLARIALSDPLTCARPEQDQTRTSACLGDVGAFQIGRLALAVEAFAGALHAAGMAGDSGEIQRGLLADVAAFGPQATLTLPAMNLIDAASAPASPFGKAGREVAGKSIVALEYLYPGIIPQMRLNYADAAAMSGLQAVTDAPRDYQQFDKGPGRASSPLDSFRIFSPVAGGAPVMQKLAVGAKLTSGFANAASDFSVAKLPTLNERRSAPASLLFGEFAAVSATAGVPLLDGAAGHAGGSDLQQSPFTGAACRTCGDSSGHLALQQLDRGNSLLGTAPTLPRLADVSAAAAPASSAISAAGGVMNGNQMFEATRSARISAVSSSASAGTGSADAKGGAGATDDDATQSGSGSGAVARTIVKKVARNVAVVIVGDWIGGRAGEIFKEARGGPLGAGIAMMLAPAPIGCGKGESCRGKSEKEYIREVKELAEEKKDKKPEPTQPPSTAGGENNGKPKQGNQHPAGAPQSPGTASPGKTGKLEPGGDQRPPSDTGGAPAQGVGKPGPRGPNLPGPCPDPRSQRCGCMVNVAGEVGVCVPVEDKDKLLMGLDKDGPPGWFVVNGPMNGPRTVFSLVATDPQNAVTPAMREAPQRAWSPDRVAPGPGLAPQLDRVPPEFALPEHGRPAWVQQLFESGGQPGSLLDRRPPPSPLAR